jgi:hypothetical protein
VRRRKHHRSVDLFDGYTLGLYPDGPVSDDFHLIVSRETHASVCGVEQVDKAAKPSRAAVGAVDPHPSTRQPLRGLIARRISDGYECAIPFRGARVANRVCAHRQFLSPDFVLPAPFLARRTENDFTVRPMSHSRSWCFRMRTNRCGFA